MFERLTPREVELLRNENKKLQSSLKYEKKVNASLRMRLHHLATACHMWAGTEEGDPNNMLPRRVKKALDEIDE